MTTLPISVGQAVLICVSILVVILVYNKKKGVRGSWNTREQLSGFIDFALSERRSHAVSNTVSNGEHECKMFLEQILGKPFTKQRPEFLKNPVTGVNLEIDCFNEELKLGVEYDGKQHSEFVPYFHKNRAEFNNQQYRDVVKEMLCRDNGVTLIRVPHTVKNIPAYLNKQLKNLGYL